MTATHPRHKASAVLWLAAGKSQRAAAEAAGVSPSTVRQWVTDPVFVAEVESTRVVYSQKPQDGRALVEHLAEVEARLAPQGPERLRDGSVRVPVAVPAGASPRQQERAVARAIARGLRVAREAES
ncbi:helix-turn-helix domain-containing protein [Streptomyces fagopyri]|uniref:Helix-turn-helix domain-containing protein n=1 Tax=Streptomyces fagopyri TaxID=2662397 RepID=A0A5Q0LAG4_9ACTN|nr:helix-turn-helix domain-containing protein [Streptomyces fagopyri]QFZ74003.1 helix-turn-helix domain-containing protein [Streptomyces fagopyri]